MPDTRATILIADEERATVEMLSDCLTAETAARHAEQTARTRRSVGLS